MTISTKRKIILWVTVLFIAITSTAFAEEAKNQTLLETVVEITARDEIAQMKIGMDAWTDPKVIEALSKTAMTEDDIKELYQKFKNALVTPPHPDEYTEYAIDNAEEALKETEALGRLIHNTLVALPDEASAKYGKLLMLMSSVLYVDTKHIPLAIKHDNSRDVYWYSVHASGVKAVEEKYLGIVGGHEAVIKYAKEAAMCATDAQEFAAEAIDYAEKAAKAETLEEAKEYANKAVSAIWKARGAVNNAKFAAESATSVSYE